MLYVEEEHEPGGEREEVLYHGPERDVEHAFEHRGVELGDAVQSVLAAVDAAAGVEDEEQERDAFGQRGAYGGSGDAEGGHPQLAEDEDVVEDDVAQHHDDGVQRERLGLCGAQKEGAEYARAEREQGAEHSPMQVAGGCLVDVFGRYDALQNDGGEAVGQHEHDDGQSYLEVDAVVEEFAYLLVLPFAVAPRHEYSRSGTETERYHEDDHVEHSSNGGCS